MISKLEETRGYLRTLNLSWGRDNLDQVLDSAAGQDLSHLEFLHRLLRAEMATREEKAAQRRMKWADFPFVKTVDEFDFGFQRSITKKQVNRLLDLHWVEKAYNLVFLGPPGVGKSHLAVAIALEAVKKGYRVGFVTMENLIRHLKLETTLLVAGKR